MRVKFLIVLILSVFIQNLFSSSYSNFKNADLKSIKAFTKDMGNIIDSSSLYSARALGFSGFAVSYKGSYQIKPSINNLILEKNRVFGINYLQFEIGLPYRLDSYIRAGGNDGLNIIGGGIRFGLKNVTDDLYSPNLILSLNSHMALYKYFYILEYGGGLAFSMRLSNYFMPYIFAGVSSVKLNIKDNVNNALIGKSIYELSQKYTAGFRLKIKWINISGGYTLFKERTGFDFSCGFRF